MKLFKRLLRKLLRKDQTKIICGEWSTAYIWCGAQPRRPGFLKRIVNHFKPAASHNGLKLDAESEERLRLILTAGGPVCFSKDEAETLDWLVKNYPVVLKLLCYATKNTKS